jgi:uncharacterized membrane-anchored protein
MESTKMRQMLNKVPEVTFYFWIIKILCTTVGETAADFLNVNLNFGLTGTSIVTGVLLLIALFFQFKAKKYIPSIYWLTVALVSVFGTLVTDNLTDHFGLPLETSTIIFGMLLALTFLVWYLQEKTLSIHSIFTSRREAFYWLTILFTFALGTAAGDLMAEGLGLGYLTTGIIVASVIAITAVAWKLRMNSVLSFWIIYILTRPLGASIGDYLSQPASHGGLGLGVTMTSAIFIGGILGIVTYLSVTKRDVIAAAAAEQTDESKEKGGLWQTVIVVLLLLLAGGAGYYMRNSALQAEIQAAQTPSTGSTHGSGIAPHVLPLGDLSTFRTITQDTLDMVNAGKLAAAKTRVSDLEYEWDNAQARLKPMDVAKWTEMDGAIDKVLRQLRAVNPDAGACKSALQGLLDVIDADG